VKIGVFLAIGYSPVAERTRLERLMGLSEGRRRCSCLMLSISSSRGLGALSGAGPSFLSDACGRFFCGVRGRVCLIWARVYLSQWRPRSDELENYGVGVLLDLLRDFAIHHHLLTAKLIYLNWYREHTHFVTKFQNS
jgi:hypothetical protein